MKRQLAAVQQTSCEHAVVAHSRVHMFPWQRIWSSHEPGPVQRMAPTAASLLAPD